MREALAALFLHLKPRECYAKVVSHTLLKPRKMSLTVNRNEKASFKCGIPVLFQNNGFPCYKTISSFIHSTFHATTYLSNLMSSYSDIMQSSKLDIHTNTLSLAHMDSFWFANLSCPDKDDVHALLCVFCSRYMKSNRVFTLKFNTISWLATLRRGLKAK